MASHMSTRLLKLSDKLAKVVGTSEATRADVTKKLWAYIKTNKLQDASVKGQINTDAVLAEFANGAKSFRQTELLRLAAAHIHDPVAVAAKAEKAAEAAARAQKKATALAEKAAGSARAKELA